jgi:hypothetical protein
MYDFTSSMFFLLFLCRIFGGAIAASAFLNLLLPGACKVHYALAMFVRILQGLVEVRSFILLAYN